MISAASFNYYQDLILEATVEPMFRGPHFTEVSEAYVSDIQYGFLVLDMPEDVAKVFDVWNLE